MTRYQFYKMWAKETFIRPFIVVDSIAVITTIVGGAISWYFPQLDNIARLLMWVIPLGVLLVVVLVGFLTAPYRILNRAQRRIGDFEAEKEDKKERKPNIRWL